MSEFSPASGVTYCVADGRAIFLDIFRDRYFCLSRESERAFLADAASERVQPADRDRLRALVGAGVLTSSAARLTCWYQEPPRAAASDFGHSLEEPSSLLELGKLLWTEMAVSRRRRRTPLHKLLENLAGRKLMAPAGTGDLSEMVRLGRVSEALGAFRSVENRCFVRSYAVASLIFAKGVPAQLVFGVSGRPFQAHCWVQYGDAVLTDRLEHVRNYTPILAL